MIRLEKLRKRQSPSVVAAFSYTLGAIEYWVRLQRLRGDILTLRELHTTELDRWVAERHYLHSTPAGAVLRLEFLENGERIGAMLWGRPTSRLLDQKCLLQLTRMYFIEDTEHCIESRALAMARKYIRKHLPQIQGLITYASTAEQHKGTIYRADGWFPIGNSKCGGIGWESREGRELRDGSAKLRFARSP